MNFTFNHFNFNVSDLAASIKFYGDAFGFTPLSEMEPEDKSFKITFMGDGVTDFRLELTWLRDHPEKYDLGECEFHLALRVEDFDAAFEKHKAMGVVCFENTSLGVYFVEDPDGYWIEVIPAH